MIDKKFDIKKKIIKKKKINFLQKCHFWPKM